MSRVKRILIALDQLINAFCNGWPDETISSRAYRWKKNGKRSWPCNLIDALFFMDPDHCRGAYESERVGRQLPPELREEA